MLNSISGTGLSKTQKVKVIRLQINYNHVHNNLRLSDG